MNKIRDIVRSHPVLTAVIVSVVLVVLPFVLGNNYYVRVATIVGIFESSAAVSGAIFTPVRPGTLYITIGMFTSLVIAL